MRTLGVEGGVAHKPAALIIAEKICSRFGLQCGGVHGNNNDLLLTMRIPVDHDFLTLCQQVLKEGHSLEEWREIESDDMFQSPHYSGGFDATEDAFCFSYYDSDGGELWFSAHAFGDYGSRRGRIKIY